MGEIKYHPPRFYKPSDKMCRVVYYKSPTCEHRWFYIARRCGEKKGFNECRVFKPHGFIPHYVGSPILAPPRQCPECDKGGKYDGNDTRMVLEDGFGCEHWGMGETHVYKSRCVIL